MLPTRLQGERNSGKLIALMLENGEALRVDARAQAKKIWQEEGFPPKRRPAMDGTSFMDSPEAIQP